MQVKVLEAEHPDIVTDVNQLVFQENRFEKSISLISDAVRDLETVLDAQDPKFKDRQRWLNMGT